MLFGREASRDLGEKIRQRADNDLRAKLQQPFYHSDILLFVC
jgi:hypothetical protein